MDYSNAKDAFIYRVRRELSDGPLFLVETVYVPRQQLPPHSHASPTLILLLEGNAEHSCGGAVCRVEAGQTVFVPPSCVHAFRFGGVIGRAFGIEFRDPVSARSLPRSPIQTSDPELVRELIAAYRALVRSATVNTGQLETGLIETLNRVTERNQRIAEWQTSTAWLARARELVSDGATNTRITSVASEIGKHPSHVSRRFRDVYRESMAEVRERARVEAASRALLSGRSSISAIAADVGYCDHAHLTRAFRRAMQMTPLDFRRAVDDSVLMLAARRNLHSIEAFVSQLLPPREIRVAMPAFDDTPTARDPISRFHDAEEEEREP